MSDLHTSIRNSSIWIIIRLIISLTVGAFVTVFIIRNLSVKDYGVYTVLYSMIAYVSVIASFGIPSVFQRFIPEALQKKEYSLIKILVFRGLMLRILLSAVTVCVILLFHGLIGRLFKIEGFLGYFSIFAWGIVLYLEAVLLANVLHSLFLHKYSVIASTIYTIFRGISVFVLLNFGWGIKGVLLAEVAAWAVWSFLQYFFYYINFAQPHTSSEKSQVPLWRFFRYGGLSSLNELGSSVLGTSTDFFVITAFLGPGAVAFYAFADRIIKMFVSCMPHVFLIDVIRPAFFTKYAESGNKQHLADMFNLLIKIGAFCVFPLAAGIFVLGDKMISIVFKPEYLDALPVLWIMIIFTAINIFANPTGLVLQSLEQVQINLYSKIFAIYNLIAELLVIQKYGVIGVVLVTCSATLMKNIFLYYYAKKYTGLIIDWLGLMKITINASLMAIFIYPMRSFINNLASLALVACIGIIVYFFVAWCNKSFKEQERKWLNRLLPKPIFVF